MFARLVAALTLTLTLSYNAAFSAPVASDFIVSAAPGGPGHYTITNNSTDWYVAGLLVNTDAFPASVSTTQPNWVADIVAGDGYFYAAFNGFNDLSRNIGPGQSASTFFFDSLDFPTGLFRLTVIDGVVTSTNPSILLEVPLAPEQTPVPGALVLFASGLSGFGLIALRRRLRTKQHERADA
jgi:hypothetical protein